MRFRRCLATRAKFGQGLSASPFRALTGYTYWVSNVQLDFA